MHPIFFGRVIQPDTCAEILARIRLFAWIGISYKEIRTHLRSIMSNAGIDSIDINVI